LKYFEIRKFISISTWFGYPKNFRLKLQISSIISGIKTKKANSLLQVSHCPTKFAIHSFHSFSVHSRGIYQVSSSRNTIVIRRWWFLPSMTLVLIKGKKQLNEQEKKKEACVSDN
jgi:hypothetical protein